MSSFDEKQSPRPARDLSHRVRSEKASKQLDIEKNPCIKEQKMSFQCLDDNGYDRDMCNKHFQNYKNCRQFWSLVVLARRKKGIEPNLPAPEDRQQALEDYKYIMSWK